MHNKVNNYIMYTELPNLYLFAKVAETLSFRETATQLHVARSTVSKRIARFERELGVNLFNRNTRRMSLTDAGLRLYQRWHEIAGSIDTALATVRDADQQPSGTLRVSMPSSLGQFQELYRLMSILRARRRIPGVTSLPSMSHVQTTLATTQTAPVCTPPAPRHRGQRRRPTAKSLSRNTGRRIENRVRPFHLLAP